MLGGLLNLPFTGFHNFTHWLEHTGHLFELAELNLVKVALVSTVIAGWLAIALSWWLGTCAAPPMYGRLPAAKRPDDPLRSYLGPVFHLAEPQVV